MTPTVTLTGDALRVAFADAPADYPLIWLRDNAPDAFHPVTRERTGDLMAIPDAPMATGARVEAGRVIVGWADAAETAFAVDWLDRHRLGRVRDPAEIARVPWPEGYAPERVDMGALADEDGFRDWLRRTKAQGLTIVTGLDGPDAGIALARRIGFLRRTNFGTTFEVRSKKVPNNLAYTSHALPLHTDLPNQEVPPGYQFLHCLENGAEGGGSTYADGIALAEDLRASDPEAFDLLATVPIPFRFHDGTTDLLVHRPVIALGRRGEVIELRWNAHLADVFDMEADLLRAYYPAYRAYMALTRAQRFRVETRLAPGEMAVFDNRRILHGRAAFDPTTGARHLRGCYVDRGEFDARLRLLGQDQPGARSAQPAKMRSRKTTT